MKGNIMEVESKYTSPWKAALEGIRNRNKQEGERVHLPAEVHLKGKKVLITGASSGLGWATAVRCASAGAEVVMVNRSGFPEKIDELKRVTGNNSVRGIKTDLSDLDQVQHLLAKIEKEALEFDLVISNAGIVSLKSRKSPQGLEEMFVVNYLAPFYLLHEMVAGKRFRKNARIIIVSSESHRDPTEFHWDKLGMFSETTLKDTVARYAYFKLLLTTFAVELSRRIQEGDPQVRSLCPGPVNSNIAREAPGWMRPLLKIVFTAFFRSPEKASDPIMYFASEPAPATKNFDYLFLMNRKSVDPKCSNQTNGNRLWEQSKSILRNLGYPVSSS